MNARAADLRASLDQYIVQYMLASETDLGFIRMVLPNQTFDPFHRVALVANRTLTELKSCELIIFSPNSF